MLISLIRLSSPPRLRFKKKSGGAGIRRTGNNLHMDTVHRYQSNTRAVSVAELKHTHTLMHREGTYHSMDEELK